MAARLDRKSPFKADKFWREAIQLAVHGKDATGKRKLRAIAEKLVLLALDGDLGAIKEIGDRLDGKAAQPISGGPELSHEQWLERLPMPGPMLVIDHDPATNTLVEIVTEEEVDVRFEGTQRP